MRVTPNRALLVRVVMFGLCALLIFGIFAGMTALKFHYDNQINELTDLIASLQVSETAAGNLHPTVNLSNTTASLSVPEIAQIAGASVAGIKVTYQIQAHTGRFGTQVFQQSSQGSGIICTSGGYIITNYHVVGAFTKSDSAQIEVYLSDGRFATAEYIGGDQQNDLAVIKIELEALPVAQFGLSSQLRVGEFAMAIGNPLGMDLAGSVTVGVISGINRKVEAENVADSLIQTDAAINPGNSGGALVNQYGQVIGINTIKIASAEVEGLGFAIPIDYAMPIIESIIDYGYVRGRPATGISGSELTTMTAHFYNVPQGLLVTDVAQGSAAQAAGIRVNDIITEFGGQNVSSMSTINSIVKGKQVGDEITVIYYRQGSMLSTKLTLMESRGGDTS